MKKEGSNFKNWKKRWFALKGKQLAYFDSEKEGKAKGELFLEGYSVRTQFDNAEDNQFQLFHPSRRVLNLIAFSAEEKAAWVAAFQAAIDGDKQREINLVRKEQQLREEVSELSGKVEDLTHLLQTVRTQLEKSELAKVETDRLIATQQEQLQEARAGVAGLTQLQEEKQQLVIQLAQQRTLQEQLQNENSQLKEKMMAMVAELKGKDDQLEQLRVEKRVLKNHVKKMRFAAAEEEEEDEVVQHSRSQAASVAIRGPKRPPGPPPPNQPKIV